MKRVAVLFARPDSVYKEFPSCDVYDQERDARTYTGDLPVVAHPPCRSWSRLHYFAKPEPDEPQLALFAIEQVRQCGGVLEHPEGSRLWRAAGLPAINEHDMHGGFSIQVSQWWFGHKCEKKTWLYIVDQRGGGVESLPPFPMRPGRATHVITRGRNRRADGTRMHKGDKNWRPDLPKSQREATPRAFAIWLCAVAVGCRLP